MERIAERERDMGRKPSIKDRIVGCVCCLKPMTIGFLTWDFAKMQLFWMLFVETALGHCEVSDADEE